VGPRFPLAVICLLDERFCFSTGAEHYEPPCNELVTTLWLKPPAVKLSAVEEVVSHTTQEEQ
jgi:hypothetical protein